MKPFNYVFMGIVVLMLIGSAIGMFFIGGYTSKTISIIVLAMAVSMITNSVHRNFFVKEKEKDERNITIENKAKAKAFDVMGIAFGILIVVSVILKYDLLITLLVGITYFFIFIVYMIYFGKYHENM